MKSRPLQLHTVQSLEQTLPILLVLLLLLQVLHYVASSLRKKIRFHALGQIRILT